MNSTGIYDEVIIPAKVRYDKRLIPGARLLYGDLRARAKDGRYYMASVHWLVDNYQVCKDTFNKWMRNLEECGYIGRETIYDEDGIRRPGYVVHIVPLENIK